MDRLANGGVACNFVRSIAKNPDGTVDIRGINNNEITSAPLVTAGEFALTTSDDIILITHQNSHHEKNKNIHSLPQT